MIKILDKENAKKIWDNTLLTLGNPNFYQSYNYSEICQGNANVEYVYSCNELGNVHIMGFIKIDEDKVSIPFGPIFNTNCSFSDVMDFITEIRYKYQKKVNFCLPEEFVQDEINKYDIEKGWCFVTPLIDTDKSIDLIVQNCNENRRRIIRKVLQDISDDQIVIDSKYAEEFMRLYKRRMAETNAELDLSLDYLEKILSYDNTKLTACVKDDNLIAGSITFEFGDTLITRYNCYDSNFSKLSPIARVDYDLLKYASLNSEIKYYDMSGLAVGDNINNKELNLNRYKLSYRPKKTLSYQWYKYN